MKPDDILTAIGEVDDEYVKRAHKRDTLKALGAAFVTFVALLGITQLFDEPDYILSRLTPDFQVNTGYVDPDHIVDDGWSTLKQTSYENGVEVSSTIFERSVFGNYKVRYNGSDGTGELLVGSVRGELYRHDYRESLVDDNLFLEAYYENDLADRIDFVVLKRYTNNGSAAELMTMLEVEYSDNGFVVKQIRRDDNAILGYRVFDYEDRRISQTKDFTSNGDLLGYATYTWENGDCCIEHFDFKNNVVGMSIKKYDWLGRTKEVETYDAAGSLISNEIYYYRVMERYRSAAGILALVVILSLTATIGIGVYEDRIRLPKRAKSTESTKSLEPIEIEIQNLRASFSVLAKNLEMINDDERNAAIKEINVLIRKFEDQFRKNG